MSAVRMRGGLFATTAVATLAMAALLPWQAAYAQAIERHLPPAPAAPPAAPLVPNAIPSDQDARPIGPALTGLLLLGPSDPVRVDPIQGLDTRLIPRLSNPAARARLDAYRGQPLSKKLIAEIEATIAHYYRRHGYPFVSVSTPPQTIGGGMLQLRVIEFRSGETSVSGVGPKAADRVREGVRLQRDQSIDAVTLEQDIDWLNRYPFRHVEAIFSPGDTLGRSNLDLQTTATKPWQIYAGYTNSGSPSTGWDRYFIGGQIGGLLVPGSQLSYQLTVSSDFLDDHGDMFGNTSHPRYISHGVRAAIPTGPRQEVEATFDHIETNASADPFAVRQKIDEATLGYRSSLSNYARLPGDVFIGIEAKTEKRITLFAGLNVLENSIHVYQAYAGWANSWSDAAGRNIVNLTVHGAPGGLDRDNGARAFATFSDGRIVSSGYVYVTAQYSRTTQLPRHWSLVNSLIGQYAGHALPDTEQTGVGGMDTVRGYNLDDGSYDSAIISRNELRMPAFSVLGLHGALADQLSPYAFVDAAYAASRRIDADIHPVSVGVGADYQFGFHLNASVTVARALSDGLRTRNGDWLAQARATLSF